MAIEKHFEEGWYKKLSPFLMSNDFKMIGKYLKSLHDRGYTITPNFDDMFRAFKECPYEKLKVVILGQDPYPQKGVADGIAFSARNHLFDPPASFKLMINAIEKEVYGGFAIGFNEEYAYPDLTRWANQGVLLVNTALSTIVGKSNEHSNIWTPFIANLLQVLRDDNQGLVYILLGSEAKKWKHFINTKSNHILCASHPASVTYSGKNVWDSEGVFLKTNELLEQMNGPEAKILW
jgi:uracil-DNA glycosylase